MTLYLLQRAEDDYELRVEEQQVRVIMLLQCNFGSFAWSDKVVGSRAI